MSPRFFPTFPPSLPPCPRVLVAYLDEVLEQARAHFLAYVLGRGREGRREGEKGRGVIIIYV